MSYSVQKNPSQIVVLIQDELTVADVKGLRNDLLAAVSDPLPVVINASGATRVDMSVVQVLYAVQKSAGKMTMPDCSAKVGDYLTRAGVSIDRWMDQSAPNVTLENGAVNG